MTLYSQAENSLSTEDLRIFQLSLGASIHSFSLDEVKLDFHSPEFVLNNHTYLDLTKKHASIDEAAFVLPFQERLQWPVLKRNGAVASIRPKIQ